MSKRIFRQANLPNEVNGEGNTLQLRDLNNAFARNSFLKFNLARLPLGAVTSAKLKVRSLTALGHTIQVRLAAHSNWDERNLAYSTAPAIGNTVFDSQVVNNTNTWYEFDVTPAITNNSTYTFVLTTTNNALTEFYSRDADWLSGPDLIVTSAPVYSQTNRILSVVGLGDGSFQLTFQGTPGAEYYLVASADLTATMNAWSPVIGSTNTAPTPGGQWSFTASAPAPRFYRLRAVNPIP